MATKGFVAEVDDWADRGESILQHDVLVRVKKTLAELGPVVVWHKFYRAARGPEAIAFNGLEEFEDYIEARTRPGDKLTVWYLSLNDGWVEIANGKCPDEQGRTPLHGAY